MTIHNYDEKIIKQPDDVYKIFKAILESEDIQDRDKEHFWIMGLNAAGQIKLIELVSLGILSCSLIHPRETFRMAIVNSCASLVLCHNHPSGTLLASPEDCKITHSLVNGGNILEIPIQDHLIITDKGYISLRQEGFNFNN